MSLVSVVVPSYQHARFIRDAIDSILAQGAAVCEVLVVDGGSTDGTHELVQSYGGIVRWIEAPGSSQAEAVNLGWREARGEVVGWLNSDDRLCRGAVASAMRALATDPDAALVYGDGEVIDEDGKTLGAADGNRSFDLWALVHVHDFITQPAVFARRDRVLDVGGLDEGLDYALDWDLWLRMAARWPVAHVAEVWAETREHAATKTGRGGWARYRELRRVMRRHGAERTSPGMWIYGLDTLRRRWPVVFGAGSRAQREALRGRWLPRTMLPLHWAVSFAIDHQMARQGLTPDRWIGRRGRLAVAWTGEMGHLRFRGSVPAELAGRVDVRIRVAGRSALIRRPSEAVFELMVAVRAAGRRGPIEVEVRASRSTRLARREPPVSVRCDSVTIESVAQRERK